MKELKQKERNKKAQYKMSEASIMSINVKHKNPQGNIQKNNTQQVNTQQENILPNKNAIKKISSKARTSILAKLKAQVNGADYGKLPEEKSYEYPELSHQEHIEQFVAHLEANHAQVINTKKMEIGNVISQQLQQRNITHLLCGKRLLNSQSIRSLKESINLQAYDFMIDGNKEMLFNNYPAALSNSRCGISATGSIVLWPDSDEPRSLSLVPPVHFVIIDAKNLYADFATLMTEQQWQGKLPTNVVLISGPSKTADIQQTLAYGAHGPKELIVLLLNA
jgi:L-lactate dehydrogenase complex protein LldG